MYWQVSAGASEFIIYRQVCYWYWRYCI